MGAYKISSKKSGKPCEDITTPNNQRFRVYRRLTRGFLGLDHFKHIKSEKANCYLLVNRNNDDCDVLKDRIIQMICNTYSELGAMLIFDLKNLIPSSP
jgi:hypothetical protein